MNPINLFLLSLVLGLFVLSCEESDDGSTTDGDDSTDGDSTEDGDVSDGDEPLDGDVEEEVVSCSSAEAGHFLDLDDRAEWAQRCRETTPVYPEELRDLVTEPTCHPVTVSGVEDSSPFTNLVFCEAGYGGGGDLVTGSWPGPGYGLASGPDWADVPTGWHCGSYQPEDEEDVGGPPNCTEAQNAALEELAASRLTVDTTPCESITDLDQCLRTHNAPFHCMPVFTLPIVDNNDGTCAVKHHSEMTCAGHHTEVGFLACRQVLEPFDNPQNIGDGTVYTGALKNSTTDECVGFSNYETAIPDGWEKVDCSACLGE